jgi:4-amino-4-deoxy-L-arabinose transferase-like glycosyltransferase
MRLEPVKGDPERPAGPAGGPSAGTPPSWLERAARGLVMAGAAAAAAVFLFVALSRAGYPYELEWLEGGILQHAARTAAGDAIYVPPSLTYTPFVYTPLYYYLAAAARLLAGSGFLPLRLVSLLATLASCSLIGGMVARETDSRSAGVGAAGLFLAAYPAVGWWYDLGRVDALSLTLLLAGAVLLRFVPDRRGRVGAGLLMGLAFFAKQSALIAATPLCLYALIQDRGWQRLLFPAALAATVGLGTLAWQLSTHGWFGYYVFQLPQRHELHGEGVALGYWTMDIVRGMGIALTLGLGTLLVALWSWRRSGEGRSRAGTRPDADPPRPDRFWFYGLLLVGGLVASWLPRIHVGGYLNDLIPAYTALAIVAGLALGTFQGRDAGPIAWVVPLMICVQLGMLLGDPRPQIPTRADRLAGDAMVRLVSGYQGEVFLPQHGYLAARAGKNWTAHAWALWEVFQQDPGGEGGRLEADLDQALSRRRYAAVILSGRSFLDDLLQGILAEDYQEPQPTGVPPAAFQPVTGTPFRPERIYLPRRERPGGS